MDQSIPLKELLQMYFERSGAVETFWSFEIVVVLGILTIMCTVPHVFADFARRLVVTIAFVLFAASNLQAILVITRQRRILRSEIANLVAGHPHIDKLGSIRVLSPPSELEVILYHLTFDALAMFLIWLASHMFAANPSGIRCRRHSLAVAPAPPPEVTPHDAGATSITSEARAPAGPDPSVSGPALR
jgi:hypothetical protein